MKTRKSLKSSSTQDHQSSKCRPCKRLFSIAVFFAYLWQLYPYIHIQLYIVYICTHINRNYQKETGVRHVSKFSKIIRKTPKLKPLFISSIFKKGFSYGLFPFQFCGTFHSSFLSRTSLPDLACFWTEVLNCYINSKKLKSVLQNCHFL